MPIIQESPSAKEARKRKKGLLTVGLTKQNLRSSLTKESLRRKVSYGYEDNRRRRDWLVVRIRSLSEYKNGYFLLQRTNQRHSELVCYWPACKQRVESIKANVREKSIMSQCLVRCKVQDFSQLSIYITCSKYNPWKSCHFRIYFLHVHYSNCKHSCVDRLFNHGVSSLFFFLSLAYIFARKVYIVCRGKPYSNSLSRIPTRLRRNPERDTGKIPMDSKSKREVKEYWYNELK